MYFFILNRNQASRLHHLLSRTLLRVTGIVLTCNIADLQQHQALPPLNQGIHRQLLCRRICLPAYLHFQNCQACCPLVPRRSQGDLPLPSAPHRLRLQRRLICPPPTRVANLPQLSQQVSPVVLHLNRDNPPRSRAHALHNRKNPLTCHLQFLQFLLGQLDTGIGLTCNKAYRQQLPVLSLRSLSIPHHLPQKD